MVGLSSIKRVVSIFILRPNENPQPKRHNSPHEYIQDLNGIDFRIAVFRRCATMPTFPSYWAGISGSIEEEDATPLDAALRELSEETNLEELMMTYREQQHKTSWGGCFGGERNNDVENSSNGRDQLRSYIKAGMHVDILSNRSRGAFGGRIIRVYPFVLTLPSASQISPSEDILETDNSRVSKMAETFSIWSNITMRGTEHDEMKFLTLQEFLDLTPCVPGLRMAFHHATSGSYLELPNEIRTWEQDRVNGAAYLARQAVALAAAHTCATAYKEDSDMSSSSSSSSDIKCKQPSIALSIAMLRPSMVPIANAMEEFDRRMQQHHNVEEVKNDVLESLTSEGSKCVALGVENILSYYKEWEALQSQKEGGEYRAYDGDASSTSSSAEFVIGTFSRSSTMKLIIERFNQSLSNMTNQQSASSQQIPKLRVVCSQSTPGSEGELMANDIPKATWLTDQNFQQQIQKGYINLVIVGADCILQEGRGVVNKVGTAALAAVCKKSNVPIICCADKWKRWDDVYPPPLENIFELIPGDLLDRVLVPSD